MYHLILEVKSKTFFFLEINTNILWKSNLPLCIRNLPLKTYTRGAECGIKIYIKTYPS